MVVLLRKRRGRLESFQLEVVLLPKKTKLKKNMEINSSPLYKEGGETAPPFQKGMKKGEKRGIYISLADEGEGKHDH